MHGPDCTAGWPAGRRSHCASCCQNFSAGSTFDKHRATGRCVNPASVGLVQNDRGVWVTPAEEEQ